MVTKLKKDQVFVILILAVATTAVFLRTYNYQQRISIVADNSRDTQVATYAADNLKLPITGNFASAGPFFYGPWWYYFLESVSFLPLGVLKYWYVATGLSLLFVALIFKVGREIENKLLGAIAAFYAAISPAQIYNSLTVWNPSITPFLFLISIFFSICSIKKPALYNLFFLGFFSSLAFTIHFQSMLIFPIPLLTLIILYSKSKSKRRFFPLLLAVIFGSLIPLLPLLYFDLKNYWFNSRNFLIYMLVDQYKIWVPNRWLSYAGLYWPHAFKDILGTLWTSYLFVFLIGTLTIFELKKFSQKLPYFLLLTSFLLEIIIFRYYRGERYTYLSLFSHPSILLLSAWATYKIIGINRNIGVFFFTLITGLTVNNFFSNSQQQQITFWEIQTAKKEIMSAFPNSSFNVWECALNGTRISHPLAYLIYKEGREDLAGIDISVCETEQKHVDWSLLSKIDLQQKFGENPFYRNVATAKVYNETVEWWQTNPPQKGKDNVWKFIRENAFKN